MAPPFAAALLLLLLAVIPAASPDIAADALALLALRDAFSASRTLRWNASSSPCRWRGVVCGGNRVTELRLPGVGLRGSIPGNALGNLTALRVLSLRFNRLSSAIPPDIASCAELRNVNLQGNELTGGIPPAIFSLRNLVRLDLSGNRLTGAVSPEFARLTRLRTLYLASNELAGELPDISYTALDLFNVSFNNVTGAVPAGLRRMPATAFLGTSMCGGPGLSPCPDAPPPSAPPPPPPPDTPPPGSKKSDKLSTGAIVGIVIGAVAAIALFVFLYLLCLRRKITPTHAPEMPARTRGIAIAPVPRTTKAPRQLVFVGRSPATEVYGIEELLSASAEVLGKGVAGTTYKANLAGGHAVAVKRLKDVHLPEDEFRAMASAIAALSHPNIVPLESYYYSEQEQLLVSKFAGGAGSLRAVLHRGRLKDFTARAKILLAAARAVAFIHAVDPGSSHGGIKPTNILVAGDGGAVITDAGVARLVAPAPLPSASAAYRGPEVTDVRRVSQKADVYSFGVVLLEVMTGKAAEGHVSLPEWVQSVTEERWVAAGVVDGELARREPGKVEAMFGMVKIGVKCTEMTPELRPAMTEVVAAIEAVVGGDGGRERADGIESASE